MSLTSLPTDLLCNILSFILHEPSHLPCYNRVCHFLSSIIHNPNSWTQLSVNEREIFYKFDPERYHPNAKFYPDSAEPERMRYRLSHFIDNFFNTEPTLDETATQEAIHQFIRLASTGIWSRIEGLRWEVKLFRVYSREEQEECECPSSKPITTKYRRHMHPVFCVLNPDEFTDPLWALLHSFRDGNIRLSKINIGSDYSPFYRQLRRAKFDLMTMQKVLSKMRGLERIFVWSSFTKHDDLNEEEEGLLNCVQDIIQDYPVEQCSLFRLPQPWLRTKSLMLNICDRLNRLESLWMSDFPFEDLELERPFEMMVSKFQNVIDINLEPKHFSVYDVPIEHEFKRLEKLRFESLVTMEKFVELYPHKQIDSLMTLTCELGSISLPHDFQRVFSSFLDSEIAPNTLKQLSLSVRGEIEFDVLWNAFPNLTYFRVSLYMESSRGYGRRNISEALTKGVTESTELIVQPSLEKLHVAAFSDVELLFGRGLIPKVEQVNFNYNSGGLIRPHHMKSFGQAGIDGRLAWKQLCNFEFMHNPPNFVAYMTDFCQFVDQVGIERLRFMSSPHFTADVCDDLCRMCSKLKSIHVRRCSIANYMRYKCNLQTVLKWIGVAQKHVHRILFDISLVCEVGMEIVNVHLRTRDDGCNFRLYVDLSPSFV